MIAHKVRNRKTTIMYALSLGFIIFIYVSYDVQIRSIIYQSEWRGGTYINIYANEIYGSSSINRIDLVPQLETWAKSSPYVVDYSWATQPLRYVVDDFNQARIINIGRVFSDWNDVYGISPNYFDVAIPGFLKVHEMDSNSPFPLLQQLYTPIGSGSALVGALYKTKIGLPSLDSQFLLQVTKNSASGTTYHRLKPAAFMDGSAGFKFSKFPTITRQDMIVSFPTFLRMCEGQYASIDEIPMSNFFLQFPSDVTDDMLDSVKKDLKRIVGPSRYSLRVHDYRGGLDIIAEVDAAMQFFFGFTVIVAMAISFFSLISSMYTNVYEQAKEIGILRALGMSYGRMQRIYVYEAFTLVFAASLMGMMIGIGVGWTVAVQRVLFTQLPVPFAFPWILFLIVFGMSVVFSIVSSYGPITVMMKQSIVSILRL